jgi:hypothetical protein
VTIYEQALDKFGIFNQQLKMVEEMAELTKEIMKFLNGFKAETEFQQSISNISEEIADVQIVLDQIKLYFFGWKQHEERKLKRLEELVK